LSNGFISWTSFDNAFSLHKVTVAPLLFSGVSHMASLSPAEYGGFTAASYTVHVADKPSS
jgi:hypothetical protein